MSIRKFVNKYIINRFQWRCSQSTLISTSLKWQDRTCTLSRDPTLTFTRQSTSNSKSITLTLSFNASTGTDLSEHVSMCTDISISYSRSDAWKPLSISSNASNWTHSSLITRNISLRNTTTVSTGESPLTTTTSS